MIDICICTHAPRVDIIERAILGIANQTATFDNVSVLLVDNGTDPPLTETLLAPIRAMGASARVACEPALGLSHARRRAIRETRGDWMIFVDDDNELASDYVLQGVRFIADHPDVGCFGGKLLLPADLSVPDWALPFLGYLGIKDLGEQAIKSLNDSWHPCEPPGAGAWVRRDVANLYADRLDADPLLCQLGRSGTSTLFSADDSCMMRGAYQLGLANAYVPGLRLTHHLAPNRLEYHYVLELMAGYGISEVVLEKTLKGQHPLAETYQNPQKFSLLLDQIFSASGPSGFMKIAQMLWHIAAKSKNEELIGATR